MPCKKTLTRQHLKALVDALGVVKDVTPGPEFVTGQERRPGNPAVRHQDLRTRCGQGLHGQGRCAVANAPSAIRLPRTRPGPDVTTAVSRPDTASCQLQRSPLDDKRLTPQYIIRWNAILPHRTQGRRLTNRSFARTVSAYTVRPRA